MFARLLTAIVILPGFALVYMPAFLLYLSAGTPWQAHIARTPALWIAALVLAVPALVLMIWTMQLFVRAGEGTPAPWDPPRKFVVRGPYAHMRNPMLGGVLLMQLAMALVLSSWVLLGWFLCFFALNTVYFIASEEPGLEARFGESYRAYKAAVPRWWPRRSPYRSMG